MTRDEYTQLVKSSSTFQGLNIELQQEILYARGKQKTAYEKIFLTEKQGILVAQKKFIDSLTDTIRNFQQNGVQLKKIYLKNAENGLRIEENASADALLQSL